MVLRLRRSGLRSAPSDQGLYLRFGQRRRHRLVAGEVQATASIEHGTSGGNDRCELEHSYRVANVRVDGFHPSLHEVGMESIYTDVDRKSTRLNSSHQIISYAVFC